MNLKKLLRMFIKLPSMAFVLSLYFLVASIVLAWHRLNFDRARAALTKVISLTSLACLWILGIKIVQKKYPLNPDQNFLIVCNHLSYLDVLIISSIYPSCFVTSKEMKNTFFLGQLCLLGGCLFVDRKKRHNIHNEIKELTDALKLRLNVAIFPEATTGDGSAMLSFKRPLFQSAIDANASVLPMCLNYKSIDGMNVDANNRDLLFWYGDMGFMGHAIKLVQQKTIIVELNVLKSFSANQFEDKTKLAEHTYSLIHNNYQKII